MNGWMADKFNELGFKAVELTSAQDMVLTHPAKPSLRLLWTAVRTNPDTGAVLKEQEICLQKMPEKPHPLFGLQWEKIGALAPVDFVNKSRDDLFAMFDGENVVPVIFGRKKQP